VFHTFIHLNKQQNLLLKSAPVLLNKTWICLPRLRSSLCLLALRIFSINPLTPELNPSSQRCLTRFFTGDFAAWTLNFVNICVKNQQEQQLFI
jgi:hypothetical protein